VNSLAEQYRSLRSFAFGDSPELADELLALVLQGTKTATCSTEDEPNLSSPGERWIVLDGRGKPRCVIESTEIAYRRFDEVDAVFAHEKARAIAAWHTGARPIADILDGWANSAKT
jgi:uncharacterized protein YhfF